MNNGKCVGILLMGGKGERFGAALPKQFHRIAGKKIYLHTLEKFLKTQLFDTLILVCPPEWISEVKEDLASENRAPLLIISGGKTRQESSLLGLEACPPGTAWVVIHDAVRPFVTRRILIDNVEGAKRYGAVDTCIPSADTIVYSREGATIDEIPPRAHYLRGQTPQSFSYPLILEAHRTTPLKNASDDCSLVIQAGHPVHLVKGEESNIKITTELDLFLAEQLFRLSTIDAVEATSHTFAGKTFALTGGTGGIGSAIKELLEKQGAKVLSIARTSPTHPTDLTSADQAKALFENMDFLDGLINCMGELCVQEFHSLSPAEIDSQIATNLLGPMYSCRYAKIKSGGHIVNIASSAYSRGRKAYAAYSAAKAGIVNFTQALAEELPEHFVNVVVPQRTNTSMRQEQFPEENPKELLDPKRVARAVADLLGQQELTGTIVEVRHLL